MLDTIARETRRVKCLNRHIDYKAQKTKPQNAYEADRAAKHIHKRQNSHAQEVKQEHKTPRRERQREREKKERKAKCMTRETKHK